MVRPRLRLRSGSCDDARELASACRLQPCMRRRSERLLVGAIALAAPLAAHAHHPGDSGWSPEPWVVGLLAFALLGYVVGVTRLWARAGTARGIGWHNVGCFVA